MDESVVVGEAVDAQVVVEDAQHGDVTRYTYTRMRTYLRAWTRTPPITIGT